MLRLQELQQERESLVIVRLMRQRAEQGRDAALAQFWAEQALREAAEDFHIDRIDSIYFTVRNESTKMQRGQIALVDPMGVCSASFGEERIKPHFIVEHKLAIKDPRALERSLTVQITDAAGETKEIGRLEYHGAGK